MESFPRAMDELNDIIRNEKCVTFCKKRCGFCEMSDDFFNSHSLACRKVMLEDFPRFMTPLQEKTNQTTLPNIYINGAHVGGYQQLVERYDRCKHIPAKESEADVVCAYLLRRQGIGEVERVKGVDMRDYLMR
jgi:glutaredoxin